MRTEIIFDDENNARGTMKLYENADGTGDIVSLTVLTDAGYSVVNNNGYMFVFVDVSAYEALGNPKAKYSGILTYARDKNTLVVYGLIYETLVMTRVSN